MWGMQGQNPTVYSCGLPASLPAPFSVVLGSFPPLYWFCFITFSPFSLSSPLLYFILPIQFLPLLLCSSFSQCRCGLGISDCGWRVSSGHRVPLGHLAPMLLVGVCGWGTMGTGEGSAACLLGESRAASESLVVINVRRS